MSMTIANRKIEFYSTLPQQVSLKEGKNIWLNLKYGNSVVVIAGKNCYVAQDVSFGRKVTLRDDVDIKTRSIVGISTSIVDAHDGKPTKVVIDNSAKTVIGKGVIIYMEATVSGKIAKGRRIDAHTVIIEGKTIYENKPSTRNNAAYHSKRRKMTQSNDPHLPSDNNV